MVAPGNVNPTGIRAPPPPGQGKHPMKAAGVVAPAFGHHGLEETYQGSPRTASSTQHSTEVLHQQRKLRYCPARMAIGGFAVAVAIGFVNLYTKKQPEATAVEAAKVVTSTTMPEN